MESSHVPSPDDAAAALLAAERSQADLVAGLRLPRGFLPSLAAAIAVQILTAAIVVVVNDGVAQSVALLGAALFVLVVAVQLVRFRRVNGAWVAGLAHQVMLGCTTWSTLAYGGGLAGAAWAGFADRWWLAVLCAAAGGAGYAASGALWIRRYRGDPQGHTQLTAPWTAAAAALVLLIAAGLGLLLLAG
ncbi:hypothetical protein [Candidatus Frankia nodulisporulans]|uniref:hypothetical protein n=1 Tax=Candidatus Frankia nodulisporulans TaxID=2060052 RepID=UPI0013D371F1|nr:hypothetical protein [Candidatus Frankia nodulisporulans]